MVVHFVVPIITLGFRETQEDPYIIQYNQRMTMFFILLLLELLLLVKHVEERTLLGFIQECLLMLDGLKTSFGTKITDVNIHVKNCYCHENKAI